jgi:hypothetical protein
MKMDNHKMRIFPAFLFLAIGLVFFGSGCQNDRPEIIPVRGKVTLEGGPWPKPGQIFFLTSKSAPGMPAKPAFAIFEKDGSFVVKTGDIEGLIPGEYRISVYCYDKLPSENNPGITYLPDKFSNPSQSGLTLKIEPGQSGPVIWEHDFPRRSK